MSEPTLYEAMTEFHNIAQAVAFSSNEIALFHALSYTWNVARRPAVIEQWAEVTARNAGLTKDTLPAARNKLVQTGVLYFEKPGNRSVPKYSLNALFQKESPFVTRELQRDIRSNPRSKRRVSDGVNGGSYQGKEKEERESKDAPAPESHAVNKPLCTIQQAIDHAPVCRMSKEEAEHWWHTRNASNWTKGSSGGGAPRKITSWQSDQATSRSWVGESLSKSNSGKANSNRRVADGFGV